VLPGQGLVVIFEKLFVIVDLMQATTGGLSV
jgi:hypothetical protein